MFRGFSPGTQNADFFRGSYIFTCGEEATSIFHFACKSGLIYYAMPSCSQHVRRRAYGVSG
jgi:hypothetical protein